MMCRQCGTVSPRCHWREMSEIIFDNDRLNRILEAPGRAPVADRAWAADLAKKLQFELERLRSTDFIPHKSGDECIRCERPASEDAFPYCTLCLLRYQRDYALSEIEKLQSAFDRTNMAAFSRAGRVPR